MIERMYTIQETAEVLRKSVKTVRRYVRDGLICARKSGVRSVVIPESSLNKFMKVELTEEQRVIQLVNDRLAGRKTGVFG